MYVSPESAGIAGQCSQSLVWIAQMPQSLPCIKQYESIRTVLILVCALKLLILLFAYHKVSGDAWPRDSGLPRTVLIATPTLLRALFNSNIEVITFVSFLFIKGAFRATCDRTGPSVQAPSKKPHLNSTA